MAQVIPESWQVPARIRQRLGSQAGRQRAMIEEGHLLLILHEVPSTTTAERTPRLFWRAPNGDWRASGGGQGNGLSALKRHIETFHNAIRALDEAVDRSVEKGATHPEPFFEVITKTTPLQRTTRNLAKALQEARGGVDDADIITLRDQSGDLERAVDLVMADAKNGLDFSIAKNAEAQAVQAKRTAQAQHRLNLLAALFFPVTAIATIFGMQLRHGLEAEGPWLFWAVVACTVAVGFIVRSGVNK